MVVFPVVVAGDRAHCSFRAEKFLWALVGWDVGPVDPGFTEADDVNLVVVQIFTYPLDEVVVFWWEALWADIPETNTGRPFCPFVWQCPELCVEGGFACLPRLSVRRTGSSWGLAPSRLLSTTSMMTIIMLVLL